MVISTKILVITMIMRERASLECHSSVAVFWGMLWRDGVGEEIGDC